MNFTYRRVLYRFFSRVFVLYQLKNDLPWILKWRQRSKLALIFCFFYYVCQRNRRDALQFIATGPPMTTLEHAVLIADHTFILPQNQVTTPLTGDFCLSHLFKNFTLSCPGKIFSNLVHIFLHCCGILLSKQPLNIFLKIRDKIWGLFRTANLFYIKRYASVSLSSVDKNDSCILLLLVQLSNDPNVNCWSIAQPPNVESLGCRHKLLDA